MSEYVDTDSRHYRGGANLANGLLDTSGLDAAATLASSGAYVQQAHESGDTQAYEFARGFADTLRDHLADQAT